MDTNIILQSISNKLSALIALDISAKDKESTAKDNIRVLARAGLTSQEIADVLGTTKNTVDVIKSNLKTKKIN